MRNATSYCLGVLSLLVSAVVLANDPFKQIEPGSPEAKAALAAAQKPVDVAAVLGRTVPEIKLDNIALSDVMDALRDLSGANVVVNFSALEAVGVKRDTPITVHVRNRTFREVFDDVLTPLAQGGIIHRADRDAIYISTKADLDQLAAFRERNAAVLSDPAINPRIVIEAGEELDRPNVRFDLPPARLKAVLAALSAKSGIAIHADPDELAKAGVNPRQAIMLRLRNPLLGDALTDALWLTGRIEELDLQVKDRAIMVFPRIKPKAA